MKQEDAVSKNQHFFIPLLLITLVSGCMALPTSGPVNDPPPVTDEAQSADSEQLMHLRQGMETLEADLKTAEGRIRQLEAEKGELEAKLEALTAIERSLHERKQRQSN